MKRCNSSRRRSSSRTGFTLMEVLLVLVILVVLGSMAVTVFSGTQERALKDAARGQIGIFERAVDMYKFHTKEYPGTLDDLVKRPSSDIGERWEGPYIKGSPTDPWDRPYQFAAPGKKNPETFDIWTMGPDGRDGTDDDIGNWETKQ